MKITDRKTFARVFILALMSLVIAVNVSFRQSKRFLTDEDATATSSFRARAQIPYDFFIAGTRLPAGDYTLSHVADGVVLFRNVKAKAEAEAFLTPTEGSVAATDHKLVFVVHDGRHYLIDLWNSDGKMVITSQLDPQSVKRHTRVEVALIDRDGTDQRSAEPAARVSYSTAAASDCQWRTLSNLCANGSNRPRTVSS